MLGTLATGCQDKPESNGLTTQVQGSDAVKVTNVQFSSLGESAGQNLGGSSLIYMVVKVTLKNNFSSKLNPVIGAFVFTSTDGSRYQAVDSGSPATVGISNDYSSMDRDTERKFTIAFRISPNSPQGLIGYEP